MCRIACFSSDVDQRSKHKSWEVFVKLVPFSTFAMEQFIWFSRFWLMSILVAFFLKAGVETVDSCRLGSGFFWCFKKQMQSGMYSIYSLLCSYGRIEQAETYKLENSSKFVMFDLVKAVWLCQVHLLGHGGLFWQRSSACKGTQKSIEITKSPCKAKCADFKSNGISFSIPNKKYLEIAMVGVLNPNGLMY